MSDPDKPSEENDSTPPSGSTPESPPPPAAPSEATPLEVMPDASPLPTGSSSPASQTPPGQPPTPGQPGQSLAVIPPTGAPAAPPPPPTPIDYAMPQSKTFIPTPALIKNVGCIIKMLFGFTVLLVLGYVMLMALNPKARQWALQGSQPSTPGMPGTPGGGPGVFDSGAEGSGIGGGRGPTPFKAVNQILAIPAQALGKTDDVVKANNARAGLLDGMIAQEEAKGKAGSSPFGGGGGSAPPVNPFAAGTTPGVKVATATGTTPGEPTAEDLRAAQAARMMALQEKMQAEGKVAPAAPTLAVRSTAIVQAPEVLAPVTLPGGIVVRPASPDGAPSATRAFLYWVVNLNIGAVNPPRVLINGRLVHEKQEISIPHGITLDRLDPATKLLHFRDQTGAVVTRSY